MDHLIDSIKQHLTLNVNILDVKKQQVPELLVINSATNEDPVLVQNVAKRFPEVGYYHFTPIFVIYGKISANILVLTVYIQETKKFLYLLGREGYNHKLQDLVDDSGPLSVISMVLYHVSSWIQSGNSTTTFRQAFRVNDMASLHRFYLLINKIRGLCSSLYRTGEYILHGSDALHVTLDALARTRYQGLFLHQAWRELYQYMGSVGFRLQNARNQQVGPAWVSHPVSLQPTSIYKPLRRRLTLIIHHILGTPGPDGDRKRRA